MSQPDNPWEEITQAHATYINIGAAKYVGFLFKTLSRNQELILDVPLKFHLSECGVPCPKPSRWHLLLASWLCLKYLPAV